MLRVPTADTQGLFATDSRLPSYQLKDQPSVTVFDMQSIVPRSPLPAGVQYVAREPRFRPAIDQGVVHCPVPG